MVQPSGFPTKTCSLVICCPTWIGCTLVRQIKHINSGKLIEVKDKEWGGDLYNMFCRCPSTWSTCHTLHIVFFSWLVQSFLELWSAKFDFDRFFFLSYKTHTSDGCRHRLRSVFAVAIFETFSAIKRVVWMQDKTFLKSNPFVSPHKYIIPKCWGILERKLWAL